MHFWVPDDTSKRGWWQRMDLRKEAIPVRKKRNMSHQQSGYFQIADHLLGVNE